MEHRRRQNLQSWDAHRMPPTTQEVHQREARISTAQEGKMKCRPSSQEFS